MSLQILKFLDKYTGTRTLLFEPKLFHFHMETKIDEESIKMIKKIKITTNILLEGMKPKKKTLFSWLSM